MPSRICGIVGGLWASVCLISACAAQPLHESYGDPPGLLPVLPASFVRSQDEGMETWEPAVDPAASWEEGTPIRTHRRGWLGGWYAGAELVVVKPYWEDEVDLLEIETDDVEFPVLIDPSYDCKVTPRLYVGYRNDGGFGGRVRYWDFDQASELAVLDAVPGFLIATSTDLKVIALDTEVTKLVYLSNLQLEFGAGARYGKTRTEAATLVATDFTERSFLGSAHFEGAGPTISAVASHPLYRDCLAVVGGIRGSLLFGESRIAIGDADQAVGQRDLGSDDVIPVVELQFGIEYARCLSRGRLALRAMMESQWWGISTPGASFASGLGGVPGGNDDLWSTDRDLGFFGVAAAAIYTF